MSLRSKSGVPTYEVSGLTRHEREGARPFYAATVTASLQAGDETITQTETLDNRCGSWAIQRPDGKGRGEPLAAVAAAVAKALRLHLGADAPKAPKSRMKIAEEQAAARDAAESQQEADDLAASAD